MHLPDRFCCVPVYGVPLNHKSKTVDFLLAYFPKKESEAYEITSLSVYLSVCPP
jgi:hypothetical protein